MNTIEAGMMLLKLIFSCFLFFLLIPMKVIKLSNDDNTLLDRFFISMIHTSLFFIISVHLLAALRIYETISLTLLSLFAVLWLIKYQSPDDSVPAKLKSIMQIFNFFEGRQKFKEELNIIIYKCITAIITFKNKLWNGFLVHPYYLFLITIILLFGLIIRIYHAFSHLYFASSDPYVHLIWSKQLGMNQFYANGIYPFGYEAIISAINKLSLIDSYYIIRFLGPLTGFLILLSILYFIQKKTKYDYIIMVATLFLYVEGIGLPINVWRQMSSLSMEFALVFFLPGIHFLSIYFKKMEKIKLILASECLLLVVLIHPYVAICLVIAYTVIAVVNSKKLLQFNIFSYFISLMILACFLGILPLLIAWISGIPFYPELIKYTTDNIQSSDVNFASKLIAFREISVTLWIYLGCLLSWFVISLFKRRIKNDIGLLIMGLLFYLMFRAKQLGLPQIVPDDRLGVIISPFFVIVIVMPFYLLLTSNILMKIKHFNLIKWIALFISIPLIFYISPMSIPKGNRYQYNDAVKVYLQIKKTIPYMNWTIISPIEELQLAYTYGQHHEIWEFVVSITQNERMKLDTDYLFLFTEKIPLGTDKVVTEEDAQKILPENTGNPTLLYYANKENRTIIQAKAYYWAENYMKTHSNMDIYLDTPVMRVYRINQSEKKPDNLLE